MDLEQRLDAPSQIQSSPQVWLRNAARSRGSVFSTAARKISRADGDGWDMDNSLILFVSKDQSSKTAAGSQSEEQICLSRHVGPFPLDASRRHARA